MNGTIVDGVSKDRLIGHRHRQSTKRVKQHTGNQRKERKEKQSKEGRECEEERKRCGTTNTNQPMHNGHSTSMVNDIHSWESRRTIRVMVDDDE
jgi:hypothetical protein